MAWTSSTGWTSSAPEGWRRVIRGPRRRPPRRDPLGRRRWARRRCAHVAALPGVVEEVVRPAPRLLSAIGHATHETGLAEPVEHVSTLGAGRERGDSAGLQLAEPEIDLAGDEQAGEGAQRGVV